MERNRTYRNIDQNDYKNFNNPLCNNCKQYTGYANCKAFPEGIPDDILTGEFDHTKKHPEQKNDILFEPITKE